MTVEKIKSEIRALDPTDRTKLLKFLRCLEVAEDPEWKAIVREAAERRALAGTHGKSERKPARSKAA